MARIKEKKKIREQQTAFRFPLGKSNFAIIGLGILILFVGFIVMAIPNDPDAFLSRTLAPILLVVAFLVVIPFGIMYGNKNQEKQSGK